MDNKPVMTKWQVVVDEEKCTGCGGCIAVSVLTFRLGSSGKAEILDQDGNSDQEKLLAAQACPVEAISVINTETGEKIWPKGGD